MSLRACSHEAKLGAKVKKMKRQQGGHGTGKTGNLFLTFSRQGKHREFCSDTEKFANTGKIFGV